MSLYFKYLLFYLCGYMIGYIRRSRLNKLSKQDKINIEASKILGK